MQGLARRRPCVGAGVAHLQGARSGSGSDLEDLPVCGRSHVLLLSEECLHTHSCMRVHPQGAHASFPYAYPYAV